ncbi:MAG: PIG-L deacetylase family protein [Bacteroidales bacterium]|jgi:LmbE family N-acetylglucosaminyl deacetylase|nr:PIG-L deacetylase family protein [Bacteroidales bacterium]
MKKIIALLLLAHLSGCGSKNVDYQLIASFQDNTVEELKIEASDSLKVLVIVPHADDETIAGGLIALLRESGAVIHLLTLCAPGEERTGELSCSASKLGIADVETAGFINNTWDDIMQDKITFWYDHKDSIKRVINNKINSFGPEILITYDSEIGGYGHPEHRISAELTEDLFTENIDNPEFRPTRLFQITLPEDLENFLVAGTPGYDHAKRLTGSDGLPAPDIAVDIRKYWKIKNEAGRCHRSQIDILRKFYIVYDDKDEEDHINAFSKEYYRLISR